MTAARIFNIVAWGALILFPVGDVLGYESAPAAVSFAAVFGIASNLTQLRREEP